MLRARVTDAGDLLPAAVESRLESRLADFERETSHQIAVLTVPGLAGEPIETFALRVAERAALGQRGLDNGILLVVAARDRAARIEVGYGLEGVVPDAVAKRVLEDVLLPRFRSGDLAGGIEAGVDALLRAARGEVVPGARRPPPGRAPEVPILDPLASAGFAALLASMLWLPLRAKGRRGLGILLSGATSGALCWLLLASLAWAAVGLLLGILAAAAGLETGGGRLRGGRGSWLPTPGGGGGFRSAGGGFSGGGGRFGGGGASGRW